MEVDTLILANSAEVRNGLLYVLGGGWMRCWPENGQYPFRRVVVAVFSVRVEYMETNQEHSFRLTLRDSDENRFGGEFSGGFKVGRDTNLTPGMSQIIQSSVGIEAEFANPGIYSVILDINGREAKRIQFETLARNPK